MTESVPPQPWAALNGGTGAAGGQDFVLFDDTTASAAMAAAAAPVSVPYPQQQQQPLPFAAVTPNGDSATAAPRSGAFTEYRNAAQPPGAPNGTGSLNESPFSSPASRPSDDFSAGSHGAGTSAWSGAGAAIPIAASQAPGSGTLSKGAPKSKRARAHGYSSSWTGGSLEKYMQQLQQASGQGQSAGTGIGSVGMMPTTSFGGFPTAASGSDWSGSDTSPRNPPSGSFGPPIHSLSLGDNGSPDMTSFGNGQLGSLFPATAADHAAIQAVMAANGNGTFTPSQTSMQQQQEDRARQQIRADLMGVDSRALKGQLRDIQLGSTSTSFPSFDTMAMQSDILFPNVPHTPLSSQMVSPSSGLYDSSGPQPGVSMQASAQASASTTSAPQDHSGGAQQNQRLVDPPPQPTRQLSERTQQAVNRARAQKPTRKRMTRDYSSTTVSPQEAFLDFQDVDSALRSSRQTDATPNVFASNTATASIPALNNMTKPSSLAGVMGTALGGMHGSVGGMTTPRTTTDTMTHEGTPSLIEGGSSGSNSRATSSIPSPSQRAPLNRGETVRPTKAQQEAAAAAAALSQSSSQHSSNTGFAQADLGMLSPADSMTNSTDDEDEKPYAPNRQMVDAPNAVSSSSANSMRQSAAPTFGPQHGGSGGGPRFSVVSSSSSESEDEDQKRNGNRKSSSAQAMHAANTRPRTMGGYGYMGSSEESGLTISTPSAPALSQQITSLGQHAIPGGGAPLNVIGMPGPYGTQVPTMFMPPQLDTAAAQNAANHPFAQRQPSSGDAPSETGSQSQDEGPRISPSIRSSAQALYPVHGGNAQVMPNMFGMHGMQPSGVPGQHQHMPFSQPNAAYAAQYASNQASHARARAASQDASSSSTGAARRGNARGPGAKAVGRKKNANDDDDEDDEESEEEDESSEEGDASDDESEGSAYQATTASAAPSKTTKSRKSGGSTAAQRRRSLAEASGDSANSGGASTLTRCDYVHPLTGEECETEFHRPYDLARHRETIHAREESSLLKAGKITRDQCVVLYREVDPAKSLATVEWRCDGENGCGALFSRKDALLRHRRIRNH